MHFVVTWVGLHACQLRFMWTQIWQHFDQLKVLRLLINGKCSLLNFGQTKPIKVEFYLMYVCVCLLLYENRIGIFFAFNANKTRMKQMIKIIMKIITKVWFSIFQGFSIYIELMLIDAFFPQEGRNGRGITVLTLLIYSMPFCRCSFGEINVKKLPKKSPRSIA